MKESKGVELLSLEKKSPVNSTREDATIENKKLTSTAGNRNLNTESGDHNT